MITRASIGRSFRRIVAGTVAVCLLSAAFPSSRLRAEGARPHMRVEVPDGASDHFLRDAIPAAVSASAPPDTSTDDFVLPEEKETKQLLKEIAVWFVAAAFIAFFIVKVFIEDDEEPAADDGNGKTVDPPR